MTFDDLDNIEEQYVDAAKERLIESLLWRSTIGCDEKQIIEFELMDGITYMRFLELVDYLKNNQKDPILSGDPYSQTDILNHLKKFQ